MKRRGFTVVETVMAFGVIALASSVVIPAYRYYQLRNELEIARQNVVQGLERARILSQVSMNDSSWGFSMVSVPGKGVLFMGKSYATRNADFDELYSLPISVSTSGIEEVVFEKISGRPNAGGVITLTSISGEERQIGVQILADGSVSVPDDWLEVCTNPYGDTPTTVRIPDSLWEYYEQNGALLGDCASADLTNPADDDVGIGPPFTINGDSVSPSADFTCRFRIIGTSLENGGQAAPMTMRIRIGSTWYEPFGDWNSPTTANFNVDGTVVYDCPDEYTGGSDIDIEIRTWEKKFNWYSGEDDSDWKPQQTQQTIMSDNGNIEVVADGDAVPPYPGIDEQSDLAQYLLPYVDFDEGQMVLGQNQALYLLELGEKNANPDTSDFQDLVILLSLYEVL